MTSFQYRGFSAAGKAQGGLVEAPDAKRARERLALDGVFVEWIATARDGREGAARPIRGRTAFGIEDRVLFYRELAALLRAGLPLSGALDVLVRSPELARNQSLFAGLKDRIHEGLSFAQALREAAPDARDHEVTLIRAGEKAAALEAVLERLAGFLEEQAGIRERVAAALIYPAIVLALALVIGIALLGFAVPAVGRLLTEHYRTALPPLTRAVLTAGRIMAALGVPAVAAGLLITARFRRRLAADPEFRRDWDRRLFRMPVAGKGHGLLVNLRFARAMALLLKGGVSLVEAMGLAGAATGSAWVAELVAAETEAVRQGSTLADAMRRVPPLSDTLSHWVRIGEAGANLPDVLENAAARFEQAWNRFVNRRLAILEPALILCISAFVFVIVLAILLPIIALNNQAL